MRNLLHLLTIFGFLAGTSLAVQAADWKVIHTSPASIDGAKPARNLLVKTESSLAMPEDPESFVSGFLSWLADNAPALKESGTTVIRILQDQRGLKFTRGQKHRMIQAAEMWQGMTVRFENVRIDYDRREIEKKQLADKATQVATIEKAVFEATEKLKSDGANIEQLAQTAATKVETEVLDEFFNDSGDKIPEKAKTEIRGKLREYFRSAAAGLARSRPVTAARKFTGEVYEQPTPIEYTTGLTKGLIVASLTLTSWNAMGLSAQSVWFWTLTAKVLAQETIFGPYIKTYLNFLNRKIEKNAGPAGVAAWGHGLGFVLFSLDKLMLHAFDPVNQTGPWDPQFLLGYVGLASIGSMLGGTMPTGINTLIAKGYISGQTGSIIMQFADLLMPIEGALLSFNNPLLTPVFVAHQTAKFSVFVVAKAMPPKGIVTLMQPSLAGEGIVEGVYGFGRMPSPLVLSDPTAAAAFLRSPAYGPAQKTQMLKHLIKTGQTHLIPAYVEYLAEGGFGSAELKEIEALKLRYQLVSATGPVNETGAELSPRARLSQEKKQIRDQITGLRATLKQKREMARTLLSEAMAAGSPGRAGVAEVEAEWRELQRLSVLELPSRLSLPVRALHRCEQFFLKEIE